MIKTNTHLPLKTGANNKYHLSEIYKHKIREQIYILVNSNILYTIRIQLTYKHMICPFSPASKQPLGIIPRHVYNVTVKPDTVFPKMYSALPSLCTFVQVVLFSWNTFNATSARWNLTSTEPLPNPPSWEKFLPIFYILNTLWKALCNLPAGLFWVGLLWTSISSLIQGPGRQSLCLVHDLPTTKTTSLETKYKDEYLLTWTK